MYGVEVVTMPKWRYVAIAAVLVAAAMAVWLLLHVWLDLHTHLHPGS
jgi:hypothetical protein